MRVIWTVVVRSGLIMLVDVETSGVTVVVCVFVVCDVVVEVVDGVDCSAGTTAIVVDTVVRDAPLDGETPLTQLVDPEIVL